MQFSSLIGKPVLSPAGETYGYVTDARLTKDFSSLSCLVCADGEEEEFYLPRRAILSLGDAVIAGRSRLSNPSGVGVPIGAEVFSSAGERLGNVCDLLFGEGAGAFLVVMKEGVRTTAPAACALFGSRVILYPDASSKPVCKPAAKKSAPKSPPAPPAAEKQEPPRETVRSFNRTNLLGRRVKKSVFDRFGSPVAVAGERVTPAMLSAARRANCLLQLAVNTLTTV